MKEKPELFVPVDNLIQLEAMEFDPQTSHDIWDESDSIDTDTMDQITERYINEASKGDMEGYVKSPHRYLPKDASCSSVVFLP